MPRIFQNESDPQEDRLNKLAAIAQIYGALSGPQFRQDELARQQDQQRQALVLSLLQQQHLQQYQQQELQQRQAALGQQTQYQQGELDSRTAGQALQEKLRTDAINARQQELSSRDDNMLYESAMRSGDPKMAGYVNQALLAQQPGQTLRAGVAQAQHQGQLADAQGAWNTALAPAWNVLSPQDRAIQFSAMQQKYGPAMNQIDYSQGFPKPVIANTQGAPAQPSLTSQDVAAQYPTMTVEGMPNWQRMLENSVTNYAINPAISIPNALNLGLNSISQKVAGQDLVGYVPYRPMITPEMQQPQQYTPDQQAQMKAAALKQLYSPLGF